MNLIFNIIAALQIVFHKETNLQIKFFLNKFNFR